jgi:molybdopterin-guanine dinucleotide biosynthesis protein A
MKVSADVGGYVLAGGRSSRMGRDKALLELAGEPLASHAVRKLRRVCADVHILSSRPELERFAPLVRDLHEGCGPMGGLEAALEHSQHEWNLFLPVDMPFLPAAFLAAFVKGVVEGRWGVARVALFTVNGVPQPLLSMLHRDVAPYVREAMRSGEHKVFPVLAAAGGALGGFVNLMDSPDGMDISKMELTEGELTEAQMGARRLWFANLNTPEEVAETKDSLNALDGFDEVMG